MYKLGNLCFPCPTFCDECTGPTTCLKRDPNRNQIQGNKLTFLTNPQSFSIGTCLN